MRIRSVRVYRYSLPLCRPLVLKGIALTQRDGLLVEVVTDAGVSGWGEAAPLSGFSQESHGQVEKELLALRSDLMGQELTAGHHENAWRPQLTQDLSPASRFAIETAVWDALVLSGRRIQKETGSFVPVNALLTSGMVEAIPDLINAGYRTIKLKVGRTSIAREIEEVRAIHGAYGAEIRLRLDANRAWSFEDAAAFVRGVHNVPYEYIEEPLAEPGRLREFVEQTGARVALDESLLEMHTDDLQHHRYAQAVVLKPTLLGGLRTVSEFAKAACALGIAPVISASFESGIGVRAMALLSKKLGLTDTAMGLDTYRWLADDVLEPRLILERGGFDVADLLGAKRHIHRDLLREVA